MTRIDFGGCMHIADRMKYLGTETAFAVADRAAERIAAGARVYPFHLGDLNFSTPVHIIEAAYQALKDGKTGYCPNGGIQPLKEALAAQVSAQRGIAYTAENVSIQPGGKPVIGKFLQIFMNPGDDVLCPSPGYPIYESQVEYWGGRVVPYGFTAGRDGFEIDLDQLEQAITPKTRLIIINDLHNPTGSACSEEARIKLAGLAQRHNLKVLLDEAYFEICYSGQPRSLVSYGDMAERSVILYTFGKRYAMTGWRLGAAIGPRPFIDLCTKLNINQESCTTHFVQYAGLAALVGDQTEAAGFLETLRRRRDTAVELLNAVPGVRCLKPESSFYLYPDVTDLMAAKGFADDYGAFADDLLIQAGVSCCTRLHFGRPFPDEKRRYLRLAFSGLNEEGIRAGLRAFREYAESPSS